MSTSCRPRTLLVLSVTDSLNYMGNSFRTHVSTRFPAAVIMSSSYPPSP
ncbi:18787_t:CDS:2 [Dentiscutata erythropus]|uniref:18787_t:CDS:1 n=1 Tax=Dentiscutata erythropus TaxID=1348616 RepID=A0A9N9A0N6_9GLOM|nr:18787_t:CDS:2 [Dentiscutata erythropus]